MKHFLFFLLFAPIIALGQINPSTRPEVSPADSMELYTIINNAIYKIGIDSLKSHINQGISGGSDQTLSFTNPNLTISGTGGNSVDLSSLTGTTLTQEQVEDFAGGLFTSNTESLITSTYDDTNGKVGLTVEPNLSNYTNDANFITSESQTLSFTNPNLSISGGNSVDLSSLSSGGGSSTTTTKRVDIKPSLGCVIGNSTVAAYQGRTAIADFLINENDNSIGDSIISIAVPGHTIASQQATFIANTRKADFDWVLLQIGLNDLNPASSSTAGKIAEYQTLIDTINHYNPDAIIIGSTMIPVYQRLVDLYTVDADSSQAIWQGLTDSLLNGHITGVDYTISNHTFTMGDPNDRRSLASQYDTGDNIHPNNKGRIENAYWWRRVLNDAGFLRRITRDTSKFIEVKVNNPSNFSAADAVLFGTVLQKANSNSLDSLADAYVYSVNSVDSLITIVGAGTYKISNHGYTSRSTFYLRKDSTLSATSDSIISKVLFAVNDSILTFYEPKNVTTSASGLDNDAAKFIAAINTTDAFEKGAVNELVTSLKDNGLWSKIYALYPFISSTADGNAYNLRDTSQYKITWNGTVTHDKTYGILPASTAYGQTGIIPSSLIDVSNQRFAIGAYLGTSANSLRIATGTANSGYNRQISLGTSSNSGGITYSNLNGAASGPDANTSNQGPGFFFSTRNGQALQRFYDNGTMTEEETASIGTNAATSNEIYVGAINLNGTNALGYQDTIQTVIIGAGNFSPSEATTLNTIIETFQQRMSRSLLGNPANPLAFVEENPDPTTGSGAPTSTPTFIGAIYVDTSAGNIYMAAGTSSSSDWKQISN